MLGFLAGGILLLQTSHIPSSPATSVSETKKSLCTREQVRQGAWQPIWRDKPPYPSPMRPCALGQSGRPYIDYEWIPEASQNESCHFEKWNEAHFCRLVKGSTVLFVGDSLSFEQYVGLALRLGGYVEGSESAKSREEHMNTIQPVCNHQAIIAYRRDDYLEEIPSAIEQSFPTVLILNRGAHFTDDDTFEEGIEKVLLDVENWKRTCKELGIGCHLFWRTTAPEHPDCQKNFKEPVNNLTWIEEYIRTTPWTQSKGTWVHVQRQNKIALNLLAKHHSLENIVLDAYDTKVRRPEMHDPARPHDCLHGCFPGTMDTTNQMLLPPALKSSD